ncbi:hypothetical protein [Streptomyces sp. NPDC090445]|uniref:hypothetical protein n=1 Tax=Streptomyces sp. NPDC090445 TaxID=3365963 RepID=UPI003823E495
MSPADVPVAPSGRTPSGSRLWGPPPWLWLTLVLLAMQIPAFVSRLRWTGSAIAEWNTVGGSGRLVVTALTLTQTLPLVFLLAGALALLWPSQRRRAVERRYGLRQPDSHLEAPATSGIHEQMRCFLAEHAPGTELRVSNQQRLTARVYPGGWRTTRVGVFSPLIVMWDKDPEAGKAVLLHEVGHFRYGEQHVAGLGSPFVGLVRAWPYVFGLFGVLPVALLFATGNATAPLMLGQIVLVVLAVPKILLIVVGALWSAELAADRYAGQAAGQPALLRGLGALERHEPGGLARLYHPPIRMRRWFAARADHRPAQFLLVLLWPAALLAEAVLDLLGGAVAYRLLGGEWDTWGTATRTAVSLAHEQLTGPLWWSMLAALALWPLIASGWPRLWGWTGPAVGSFSPSAYAMSALLPVTALLLGLIPPPAEATGPPQSRPAGGLAGPASPRAARSGSGTVAFGGR